MVCLGLKPGVAGWKVKTNPLSYGGTLLLINCLLFFFPPKNCSFLSLLSLVRVVEDICEKVFIQNSRLLHRNCLERERERERSPYIRHIHFLPFFLHHHQWKKRNISFQSRFWRCRISLSLTHTIHTLSLSLFLWSFYSWPSYPQRGKLKEVRW